jgi:hypothetical protein
MNTTVQLLASALKVNRHRLGGRRENSIAVRVLADAVREAGDERLADIYARVADLVDDWTARHPFPVFYVTDSGGRFIEVYLSYRNSRSTTRVLRVRKSTGEATGTVYRRDSGGRWRAQWDRRSLGSALEVIDPPQARQPSNYWKPWRRAKA